MISPAVVLSRPKYSENIGSVARACANMGCAEIVLVSPRGYDSEKAAPLATAKGRQILEKARQSQDLNSALGPYHIVYATTARIGGWRKGVLDPEQAALGMVREMEMGKRVAITFGPEDTGLTNAEIELCDRLVCIPTASEAWSLNIAQAVLIILYEWSKKIPQKSVPYHDRGQPPFITHEQRQILYSSIQKALLDMDYLHPDNPDYFMMAVKRFLNNIDLRRHEFDLLMGVCRQIGWLKREAERNRGTV